MRNSQAHFVFLNQYYPPDLAPTGVMLRDVAEEMVARGNRVTILCSKGGYSGKGVNRQDADSFGKVEVVRVPTFRFGRQTLIGKLCDYASFYLFAFLRALTVRGQPTCYVALTTPPYLGVLARLVSKFRGAGHAHWVMDLYPDVMVAHGILKEGSMKEKVLRSLSCWSFGGKRNQGTVSLGPDMAERIMTGHGVSDCETIPLWSGIALDQSAEEMGRSLRTKRGWEEKTVFLYSGNMGLGHRLGEFLSVAKENGQNSQIYFAFYGGGKRRKEVEEVLDKYDGLELELGNYVPEEQLAGHLLSADVHLASLEPSWDGCMVPSKIQGVMASGRPVIFIGSEACSIGQWILESGGGWVVSSGDLDSLYQALEEAQDEGERARRGAAALSFSEKMFSKKANAKRYANFFALNSNKLNS
ncbi:glycosyltransferase family 4 protein [Akkermansiaceae bacterium]|nr:glycosyltransferase family 4 protein [Akkermansiaceae bacterium]MDB4432940.1 glycosyltransferase family 4 protein [Akkermansiaceae bacterium]